jgi:hypothetical protein
MPEDYSAIIREAADLEASILSGQPTTPTTTPTPAVQQAATPPAAVAPVVGQPETDEALEQRLRTARDAELLEAQRPANEALLRDVLRSHGIDYQVPEPVADRTDPNTDRPTLTRLDGSPRLNQDGTPERPVPMSKDTLYALRLLNSNRPELDLFGGARIPGNRR